MARLEKITILYVVNTLNAGYFELKLAQFFGKKHSYLEDGNLQHFTEFRGKTYYLRQTEI